MVVLFSVGCDDNVMVCSRLGQNKIIGTHMNYVESWDALDYEAGGSVYIYGLIGKIGGGGITALVFYT